MILLPHLIINGISNGLFKRFELVAGKAGFLSIWRSNNIAAIYIADSSASKCLGIPVSIYLIAKRRTSSTEFLALKHIEQEQSRKNSAKEIRGISTFAQVSSARMKKENGTVHT